MRRWSALIIWAFIFLPFEAQAHSSISRAIPTDYPRIINVKSGQYGATGDGVTNDRTAIAAAITACTTSKGTVYLPAGTYVMTSGITLSGFTDCSIRGAGREATVIDCSSVTGADCFTSGTTLNRYSISDLTIKGATSGGATPNAIKVRKTDRDVVISKVGFNLTTGQGIYCNGCTNLSVVDSEFYSDGDFQSTTEKPRGVYVDQAADNVSISHSGFYFMYDSIYLVGSSTSPVRNIRISENTFDSSGFTNKARYTGSGGTVSYGATTLVDSAAPFTANGVAATTIVRVLATAGTGTITSSAGGQITDSSASFASTVIRGDIIRTSTAFAIVEQRLSSTSLAVSEWRDLTTYRPVAMPANSTAYTLYDTVLGEAANSTNTTSTITVNQWFDPAGVASTPSSSTLYEVSWYRGGYAIKSTAGVNNVAITNNLFERMSSAAVELSGTLSLFSGNICKDGLDGCIGIQGGGRSTITGNISDHTYFFAALYLGSSSDGSFNTVSNNVVRDTHWSVKGSPPTYTGFPIVIRSSDNNVVTGNILEKGSIVTATSQYGIFVDDDPVASSGNDATSNYISGNMISGFDTASIRLEDADAASTIIADLNGSTISDGGSSGTTVNGLALTDSPGTCNSGATGRQYQDASLAESCVCTGSSWVQVDGGGAC